MEPILTLKNVTKEYPGVVALDHMNLEVYPGEVHALMGENGAGKSTLIKVVSGAIKPNGGTILYERKEYTSMTPALSKKLGIGVIYQEFNLVPDLSVAENILLMLRPDMQYTQLEATILDLALVLHMEHGGGNNSTFTTHVVTSSGTDTYSAVAAALGSLKGPKHGGANIKVVQMFKDMKKQVKDWTDEEEVGAYLRALLHKEAFDKKGLIYGMGHAVYSISDPRAEIFKGFVQKLAHEKGKDKDFALYSMVEQLAPKIIGEERHIYKGVSANVDFYSGFVYSMLDLPTELFTPMFAIARIVGWSAHRMEELINMDKIIRPAYKTVKEEEIYRPLEER